MAIRKLEYVPFPLLNLGDFGKKEVANGSYGWFTLIYLLPPPHNKLLLLAKKYLLTHLGLNIWRHYRNIPLRLMLFGLVRMALR